MKENPLEMSYQEKEASLMINKLKDNPDKIPPPSRDNTMKLCQEAFNETLSKVDVSDAFKWNAITINLDGSEDHFDF